MFLPIFFCFVFSFSTTLPPPPPFSDILIPGALDQTINQGACGLTRDCGVRGADCRHYYVTLVLEWGGGYVICCPELSLSRNLDLEFFSVNIFRKYMLYCSP
jgi:hypothetical protein